MAEPDCPYCEVLGFRSCDRCGGVVMDTIEQGPDICGYCVVDLVKDVTDGKRSSFLG